MTLVDFREELALLEFIHGVELESNVSEGSAHKDLGTLVQAIARKDGWRLTSGVNGSGRGFLGDVTRRL